MLLHLVEFVQLLLLLSNFPKIQTMKKRGGGAAVRPRDETTQSHVLLQGA